MKWKQMFFTIVLNIFLMLMSSIMLEYANLTERFIALENTVQEALDMAISQSVHSEEFFSAEYQSQLMSYAGISDGSGDITAEANTLVWLPGSQQFAQINTYQLAFFYRDWGTLPSTTGQVNTYIATIGTSHPYGLSGFIFEWLYGNAGSDYLSPDLAYANRNSSRILEYSVETHMKSRDAVTNPTFKEYFDNVGRYQETAGYLKERIGNTSSYQLTLKQYPVLYNMGLSWMDGAGSYTSSNSTITADNLCSSLHIGKSRFGTEKTYYFLTPASLGVTYVPTEVLLPVFVADLDTLVRLNKLGAASQYDLQNSTVQEILNSAGNCLETNVYDFNTAGDAYENVGANAGSGYQQHIAGYNEQIVTDGLVEFDLNSVEIKVDYFWWDFNDPSHTQESALLISKLNGTLTPDGVSGANTESALRQATLSAFQNQDSSRYVSPFTVNGSTNLYNDAYSSIQGQRIIARVSAKIKVYIPYQSAILQWANYMFTGTHHYGIKMLDPGNGAMQVGEDGVWYQYTTYFCTSRS